jgi:hypothetical protein
MSMDTLHSKRACGMSLFCPPLSSLSDADPVPVAYSRDPGSGHVRIGRGLEEAGLRCHGRGVERMQGSSPGPFHTAYRVEANLQ